MHDAVNKERQKKHFCLSRSAVTGKCRSTKDLHRQWSLVSADLSTTSRRNFPLFALSCCRAYLILTDRGPSSRRGDVGVEKTAAMQVTTFYDGGERICFGAVSIISCHVGILGLLRWTKLMTGSINGRDIAQLMWLGLLPRVHSFCWWDRRSEALPIIRTVKRLHRQPPYRLTPFFSQLSTGLYT